MVNIREELYKLEIEINELYKFLNEEFTIDDKNPVDEELIALLNTNQKIIKETEYL